MQALRTLFWIVVAVVLTIFTALNAQPVEVTLLPGNPGTVAEMPLAVLIILVFLAGFVPAFLMYVGNRWRLKRRIGQQEQTIAQLRPTTVVPPVPAAPAPAVSLGSDATPGAPVAGMDAAPETDRPA